MPNLFDAHCHATRKMSASPPPSPLSPPPANPPGGVRTRRLVCGVTPGDWEVVADWAREWEGTLPAFGVHPWEAAGAGSAFPEFPDWEEELERLLVLFPGAWVGEIGLDAAKERKGSLPLQRDALSRQLRIAARLGRPVNAHCVKAYSELLAELDRAGVGKCIVHSFAGDRRSAEAFAARGAYFSVGPLASRRDSRKIRERAAALPLDRIVLESDAFLEPGVDAEEELLYTLRWLSGVKGVPAGELAHIITDNSRRLIND